MAATRTSVAPSLSLSLVTDSGSSASDGVTNANVIKVNGLEAGANWQYQVDDGEWKSGHLQLADVSLEALGAQLGGGWMNKVMTATAVDLQAVGSTKTVWMVGKDVNVTKGVKLEFSEDASGRLQVKALESAYASGDRVADWSTVAKTPVSLAGTDTGRGYGIKSLTVQSVPTSTEGYVSASTTALRDDLLVISATDGRAHSYVVRQTDTAGNTATSAKVSYTLDTTASLPQIHLVTGDDRINALERDAGVDVTGSAEAGSTVEVTWGTVTRTVTANEAGDWTARFETSEVPSDGSSMLSVKTSDLAGNVSAVVSRSLTVDTVASATTASLLKATDDAGSVQWTVAATEATRISSSVDSLGSSTGVTVAASVSRDLTVEGWFKTDAPSSASTQQLFWLPGSASGSSFELLLRGGKLITWATGGSDSAVSDVTPDDNWHHYAVSTDGSGSWKVYVDGALVQTRSGPATETSDTFTATVGNHNRNSNSFNGLVGNVQLWDSERSAAQIAQDMRTTYSGGKDSAGAAVPDLKGSWLLGAGLANEVSGGTDATRASGSTAADIGRSYLSNDATQTLSGTLSAELASGESLVIWDGTTVLGTATVAGKSWTFTTPVLAEGSHSLTARVLNGAGNLGTPSKAYSVQIDLEAPTAIASLLKATDDAGSVQWTVAATEATRISSSVGGSGSSTKVTVAAAISLDLTVQGWFKTDAASSTSAQQLFWLPGSASGSSFELLLRGGKLITWATGGSDSAVSDVTPDDNWHHYAVSTDGSGSWKVYVDGALVQTRSGPATGTSDTFTATVGNHNRNSNSFNGLVGNVQLWDSERSAAQIAQDMRTTYSGGKDSAGAAVPDLKGSWLLGAGLANEVSGGTDATRASGSTAADIGRSYLSNDATQTLSGTLSAELASGESLVIWDGTTVLGTATVTGKSWTFTTPVLAEGSHSLTAQVRDAAGNLGTASKAYSVRIEDTAVLAPTLSLAADTGAHSNDGITAKDIIKVSGLLSGATWEYQEDDKAWIGGSGNEFKVSSGSHSYAVRQIDAHGNVSVASNRLSVTLDTTAPTQTAQIGVGQCTRIADSAGQDSNYRVSLKPVVKGDFTVEGWFKADDPGQAATQQLFWLNGKELFIRGGALYTWASATGDLSVGMSVDSKWHHYALSTDGSGNWRLYVDGVFKQSTLGGSIEQSAAEQAIHVGNHQSNSHSLNGLVGNVQVWDTQRSSPEILQDMRSAYPGGKDALGADVPGLQGSWLLGSDLGNEVLGGSDASRAPNSQVFTGARIPTHTIQTIGREATRIASGVEESSAHEVAVAGTVSLDLTVQGWFKADAPSSASAQQLFWLPGSASGSSFELFMRGGKLFSWATGGLVSSISGFVPDDDWHHYAITTDGAGDWRVYVDGALLQTRSGPATASSGTYTATVGNHLNLANSFHGLVGNLQLWDSERSGVEIAQDMRTAYSGGKDNAGVVVPDLKGSWLLGSSLANEVIGGDDAIRGSRSTVAELDRSYLNNEADRVLKGVLSAELNTGESLAIFDGSTQIGTATVTGQTWVFTLPAQIVNGHTLSAKVQDIAGNFGPDSTSFTVHLAIPAPLLSLATDTGVSSTDGVTQVAKVLVAGVTPGNTWYYQIDGAEWKLGGTTSTSSTALPSFELQQGQHTYAVRQGDASGNLGAVSKTVQYTLDTISPTGVPVLTLAHDTGTSATDGVTAVNKAYVTGIDKDHHWQYSIDKGETWVNGSTTTVRPALSELSVGQIRAVLKGGFIQQDIQATVMGLARPSGSSDNSRSVWLVGLDGVYTKGVRCELSLSAEGQLQAKILQAGYMIGDRLSDWMALVNTPNLQSQEIATSGTASGYGVKSLAIDGLQFGSGYLRADRYTVLPDAFALELREGVHEHMVRQIDRAGNVGASSAALKLDIDSTRLTKPTLALKSDTGSSSTDGITSDGVVVVSGLGDKPWQYSIDGGVTWKKGLVKVSDLTADMISGSLGGGSIFGTLDAKVVGLNAAVFATTAWLVAFDGIYTKGVQVKFLQQGDGSITAAVVKAKFAEGDFVDSWAALVDSDSRFQNHTLAQNATASGYGVQKLQIKGVNFGTGYLSDTGTTAWTSPLYATSIKLPEGHYSAGQVQLRQSDDGATGHVSSIGSNTSAWRVDATAPSLQLGLHNKVTGIVEVTGLNTDTPWEFRVDGGAWTAGQGTSFELSDGSHTYDVQQRDAAGNVGTVTHTLYHGESLAALRLMTDTGPSSKDGVTRSSLVDAGHTGIFWYFSLNGGQSWEKGTSLFGLNDLKPGLIKATLNGGAVGGNVLATVDYMEHTDDGKVTAWLLYFDSVYTKGVKVEFSMFSGTLSASVVSAKYAVGKRTFDWLSAKHHDQYVALSDSASGYGVKSLSFNGLSFGVSGQYLSDGGNTLLNSAFYLPEGQYAPGDVLVKKLQFKDGLAKEVGVNQSDWTVDRKATALQLSIDEDQPHLIEVSGLEKGATWAYQIDGGAWVAGQGASFEAQAGTHTYAARQTDAAGNVWVSKVPLRHTLNLSAPSIELLSDAGLNNSDGVTANAKAVVSHIKPGHTWQYQVDGGDWRNGESQTLVLKDLTAAWLSATLNGNSIQSDKAARALDWQQTDEAIKTWLVFFDGVYTKGVQIEITQSSSGTLMVRALTAAYTSGDHLHDWATATRSSHPLATSDLAAGYGVKAVQIKGTPVTTGYVTADATSLNSFTYEALPLQEGEHRYAVRQIDSTGRVSMVSKPVIYTLDTQAPVRPDLRLSLDSGSDSSDGLTRVSKVIVSGVEADATWEYQVDGGVWKQGGTGATSASFDLAQGRHSYAVRQIDAAGNVGRSSTSVSLTLDTEAPTSPPGLTLSANTDAQRVIQISGLESGATWEYQIDGGSWTAGSGTSLALNAGVHTYTVRQLDKAGNPSISSSLSADLAQVDLKLLADTGLSSTDGVTHASTVAVVGLGKEALWQYQVDGGAWKNGGFRADLTATAQSFDLLQGQHSYAVRQVNAAGEVIATSPSTVFTLDTTAPNTPTLSLAPEPHDVAGSGVSKMGRIVVTGLETNSTWQYRVDGGFWLDGTGDYFWGTSGQHFYEVRTRDAAGNVSSAPNLLSKGDRLASASTELVWSQQVELKAGALYDFSALALARAGVDLQLTVNGEAMGGSFQPQVGLDWQQWGLRFVSSTTGTVTLGIRDKGTGTASKDFSFDKLSLQKVAGIEVHTQTLSLSLQSDTGKDAQDGVTQSSTLEVEGLSAGQSWQWRVDGGEWKAGSGTSFEALAGKHSYEVRGQFESGFAASSPALTVRYDNQAPEFDNRALHIDKTPGGSSKASAKVSISSADGACVGFWARALELTDDPTQLLDTQGKLGDLYFENGKLVFEIGGVKRYGSANGRGTDLASEGSVKLDTQWHHYAVNVDENGAVTVYQDGRPVVQQQLPAGSAFTEAQLTLGGHATLGNRGWGGDFLNIQVWDKSRSTSQVMSDQQSLLAHEATPPDLKAYWLDGSATLAGTPELALTGRAGRAEVFKVLELKTRAPAFNLLANGDMDDAVRNIQGDYSLRSTLSGSGSSTVLSTAPDWGLGIQSGHGGGGQFLMVDGATDASKKAWSQTVRLEAGVSYDFKGFVAANANVSLQLTVNGVDIGESFRPTDGAGWQPWSTRFTSSTAGEVTLGIRAKSTDAIGNDFALDSLALYRQGDGWSGSAITRDGQILVNGLVADAEWQWRMDGGPWRDGDSKTLQFQAAAGKHVYQVRLVDTAGNVGAASAEFTVDYDNIAPTLDSRSAVSVVGGEKNGAYAAGGQRFSDDIHVPLFEGLHATWTLGADKPITFSGQYAAERQEVQVFVNGSPQAIGTTTTDNNGHWTLTLLPEAMAGVPMGRSRIDIRVMDAAGNLSASAESIALFRTLPLEGLSSQPRTLGVQLPTDSVAARQTIFLEQMEDNAAAVSYSKGIAKLGTDPGLPPSGTKFLLANACHGDGFWNKTIHDAPAGEILQLSFMLCVGNAAQHQLPQIALWANGVQVGDVAMLTQGSGWTRVSFNFVKAGDGPLTLLLKNVNWGTPTEVYFGLDDLHLSHAVISKDAANAPSELLSAGSFELGSLKSGSIDGGVALLTEGSASPSAGEAAVVSVGPAGWRLGSNRAHGGDGFLAVQSKGGGQSVWSETLGAQPGATLALRFWVTTGDGELPELRLRANGHIVSDVVTSAVGKSQAWTQVQVTFTTPKSTAPLQLSLEDVSLKGARFGLDDLALYVVSPGTGSALADDDAGTEPGPAQVAPDSTSISAEAQSMASALSNLLAKLQKATSESDTLSALTSYIKNYSAIETPSLASPVKPYISQLTEQVIDDRWRLLIRTIFKEKFATTDPFVKGLTATTFMKLYDRNDVDADWAMTWSEAQKSAKMTAKLSFVGMTGRLLGTAWNHATAYALGTQISNFKLTGDEKGDQQANLKLATSAMFEVSRLLVFMTAPDSPLTTKFGSATDLGAKGFSKTMAMSGFSLSTLIRMVTVGSVGMDFDKAVKLPEGEEKSLALARATFDLFAALTGVSSNFGLAVAQLNTGARDGLVNSLTNRYLRSSPQDDLDFYSRQKAQVKANFEDTLSFGKASASRFEKATAYLGIAQSISSLVSLGLYLGDKNLTPEQKAALGSTLALDATAALIGIGGTIGLQKAMAVGAGLAVTRSLGGVLVFGSLLSYINPLQIEKMISMSKNADTMQELADALGRTGLGYSGDQILADLYKAQVLVEGGLYGSQIGLGIASGIAGLAGGPVGWAISLVTGIISTIVEAVRQSILEHTADAKRQQMLDESGGDLHAYFIKGLEASFANMLKDPKVRQFYKEQLTGGDFDQVIGLVSLSHDSAMQGTAAITKTTEFLPQWKLFTADMDKALALNNTTSARVDEHHLRINVASTAENQKVFLQTPLAPHSTSESIRVPFSDYGYQTTFKSLQQSGWTIEDGASNSVLDLSNVVSAHMSQGFDALRYIKSRLWTMCEEWSLNYLARPRPFDDMLPEAVKREMKTTTGGASDSVRGANKWMEILAQSGEIDQYFREFFTSLDPWSGASNSIASKYKFLSVFDAGGPGAIRVTGYAPDWGLGNTTPHSGSKLLMVDGSTDVTKSVWSQEVELVAGQTYDFRAWMMSNPGARLRLTVDGVDVTYDLTPSKGWGHMLTSFTSTKTGRVTLGLRNNNDARQNNDFALDDLTLRPSGSTSLLRNGNFDTDGGFASDYVKKSGTVSGSGEIAVVSRSPYWGLGIDGDVAGEAGKFLMVDGSTDPQKSFWSQEIELKAGMSYDFFAHVAGNEKVDLQLTVNGRDVGSSFQPKMNSGWQDWRSTFTSNITGVVTLGIRSRSTDTSSNDFALDGLSLTPNLIANGGFEEVGGFSTSYWRELSLSSLEAKYVKVNFVGLTQVNANAGDDVVLPGLGEYVINGGQGTDMVDYGGSSDAKSSLTFKYTGNQVTVEKRNLIGSLHASGLDTSSTSYGKRTEIVQYLDIYKVDDVRIDSRTLIDRLTDVELIKGSKGRDFFLGDMGDQYFACNDLNDFFSGGGGTDVVDMHQITGTHIDLSDMAHHFKDIDLAVFGDTRNPRTTILGGDGHQAPTLIYGNGRDTVDASKLQNAGAHVQKVASSAVSGVVFKGSQFADIVDYSVTLATQTFSEFKVDTGDGNDVVNLSWNGSYEANGLAQDTVIGLGSGSDTLYLNLNCEAGDRQTIYADGGKGSDLLFIKGRYGVVYDDAINPNVLRLGNVDVHLTGFETIRGTAHDDVFMLANGKTDMARYFFGSEGNDIYIGSRNAIESIDYSMQDKGLRLSVLSGDKSRSTGENAAPPGTLAPLQKLGLDGVDVVIGTTHDDVVMAGSGGEHYELGLGHDIFFASLSGKSSVSLGNGDDQAYFLGGSLNLKGGAGRDTFTQVSSATLTEAQLEVLQKQESQVWITADGGDKVRLSASNFSQSIHIEHSGQDWGNVDVYFDDGGASFDQFLWFKDSDQKKLMGLWSPSESAEGIKTTHLKLLEFSLEDPATMLHFDNVTKSTAEIATKAFEDNNLIETKTLQSLDDLLHKNSQFDNASEVYLGFGEGYLMRLLATQELILSQAATGAVL